MAFSTEQNVAAVQRLGLKRDMMSKNRYFCYRHKETRPSLNVSPEKGIYHCFSCDDGGTINSLCIKVTGRTQADILGLAGDAFAMFQRDRPKYEPPPEKTEKDCAPLDIRGVVVPFEESDTALAYLATRGIPVSVAQSMNMMYTEEAYINGTHMSKRLLIPIYDDIGRWINVEARDTTFQHPAKCLYPHNTTKTIYEWYKLDKEAPLYLFEGIVKMAVARSDEFFKNSTAMMGTGLVPYQIRLLNLFKHVILVPDNDAPGQKLIDKLQQNLTNKFSTYKIVDSTLKDVDEIPTKRHTSVKEYRENGGFVMSSLISFVF